MRAWLKDLDELLRGNKTRTDQLARGTGHMRLGGMVGACVVLGIIYGVFMGLFAVLTRQPPCFAQLAATAIKTPALFLLTLVVTFPSLYVFSALLGVRLDPRDTLRLIVSAIAVNLAVLASFAPITGFFTLSTTSYPFIKLLNVFFFAVAGAIGLGFLLNVLGRVEIAQQLPIEPEAKKPEEPPAAEADDASASPSPEASAEQRPPLLPWPLPGPKSSARQVFQVWVILYALVGAQMGWILRPFVGSPELPFVVFRGREANIFLDVLRAIGKLLGA